MRHLKETLFILWIGAILSSLLLTQPSSIYAGGASPSSLFEKAKTCQSNLLSSNKVMKYRRQWEKCITLYQKFIRSPKEHPSKEEAMFHLAELYLGLSKFSGKAQDLKMAEQMAAELRMKYPASH
ncbi:MAG: tetratricopeptide repeat protein, partial [Nitrospiria bacterium]